MSFSPCVFLIRRANTDPEHSDDNTLRKELSDRVDFVDGLEEIQISPYRITLPRHVKLDDHEVMLLQNLQERIRMHGEINAP